MSPLGISSTREVTVRITKEDCLAALAPIRPLIEEGIKGTRHAGVHLLVMDAESGVILLDEEFGYLGNPDVRMFRNIAFEKVRVIRQYGCSISELRKSHPEVIRQHDLHNGGDIENGIIVVAAGASPIGNTLIVLPMLDSLSKLALASLAA